MSKLMNDKRSFFIRNTVSNKIFGLGLKNGIRKYGFYKDDEGSSKLMFTDLEEANRVAQILYDVGHYKSLKVEEVISYD